jgi:hypothetical protein
MVRRLIVLTALAAGMSFGAAMTLATPALAKGPSQARITGPGLSHAIVVAGGGEPGEQTTLASLAQQTNLFIVLFGPGGVLGAPRRLHTPPPKASLGPRYTVVYTVPGVEPKPGQQTGQIRQDIYPYAKGGPLIYTPSGQHGFGQNLKVTGWAHGGAGLRHTLATIGALPGPGAKTPQQPNPTHTAHAVAAQQAGPGIPGLAATGAALAAAFGGALLWLRHRRRITSA